MNGLDAIKDRILSEAQNRADKIAEQAQAQCAEIIAEAKTERDKLLDATRQNAFRQADVIIKRAQSTSALESHKMVLQARQDQISNVISHAAEMLCQLPDQEKIDLYRALLKQTGASTGDITLAAADLHLGSEILKDSTGKFNISPVAGSFSGGFVLRRDLIEDNLTFERLIAADRSQLVRIAAAALIESVE